MKSDTKRVENEFKDAFEQVRRRVEQDTRLLRLVDTMDNAFRALKDSFAEQSAELNRECIDRDQTEEALRLAEVIIDNSPAVLFRREADVDDPRLVYVSDNISQWGYSAGDFLSGKIIFREIVHADDTDRVGDEVRAYTAEDREEYTQHYRIMDSSGGVHWVEDRTSVVRDSRGIKTHNQGILVDITERRLAEKKLRKSEEKFRRIVETAGEGFILMDENLVIREVNDAFCRLTGYAREALLGMTPIDLATEDFKHYLTAGSKEILAREYREIERNLVSKSGRHIPILVHGSTLRNDKGGIIGNMAFVTDMTEHKKALALAAEVQKSLLPHEKPIVKGLDIAGKNVSCDEIGGDYFDFIWRLDTKKGPFSVVVGDISGHGVDSALLMTTARAFLRMRASQPGTISEIVTAMNRHLTRDILESGRFMTLFYMTIDPENSHIDWVRAGHDPAIIYDPTRDEFEELKGSGVALGVNEAFDYEENCRRDLTNGQIIAIGTDGIWEAVNREGEMFGKTRFRNIIRENAHAAAGDILNAVYSELNQYTRGQRSEDDITLVVVKIDGIG
jgi:sigma-B regulation protein RsbU (phosphoserine phosphatase)